MGSLETDQRKGSSEEVSGALVIMPTPLRASSGPVAIWLTAAGWADACKDTLGSSWLITPDGTIEPEMARRLATTPRGNMAGKSSRSMIPVTAKTFLKDVRSLIWGWRFRSAGVHGPWTNRRLRFVWQRHDLFQSAGLIAARRFGCPMVLFVDAPVVWEARKWGVRRPWGRILELLGERTVLRRADLVACVSEEVAEEVCRFGVERQRIIVTPCAVDLDAFQYVGNGTGLRLHYGLEDAFVVGWTGSFRKFHGLGVLLDAAEILMRHVPDLALILVGDGQERAAIEKAASEKGLKNVVFTGTVPYASMAAHVSAFDVAVVTAPATTDFHYSPLKLKEYMACGRAIVAPRVGSIPSAIRHEHEGLLVEPGSAQALADALRVFYDKPILRKSYGEAALERVHADGTWEHQVRRVLDRLSETVIS